MGTKPGKDTQPRVIKPERIEEMGTSTYLGGGEEKLPGGGGLGAEPCKYVLPCTDDVAFP